MVSTQPPESPQGVTFALWKNSVLSAIKRTGFSPPGSVAKSNGLGRKMEEGKRISYEAQGEGSRTFDYFQSGALGSDVSPRVVTPPGYGVAGMGTS